jgi:uncharacterized protein (DUF2147 family)
MHRFLASVILAVLAAGPALAAEPIVGTWQRGNGTLIEFAPCSGGVCGTVRSGEYAGQAIGQMSGTGGSYQGTINVLDEGKTYKGKAVVDGNTMRMSGCVLGGLICRGEDLTRQ